MKRKTLAGNRWLPAVLALATSLHVHGAESSWTYTGTTAANNSWGYSNAATPSWSSNVIPNAPGDIANLTANITAVKTITLDTSRTIGKLVIGDFDSLSAYTVSAGTPTSSQLIFDQPGTDSALLNFKGASFAVTTGASTISAPIALADNLRVWSNIKANNTLSGVISGSGTLTFDNDDGLTPEPPSTEVTFYTLSAANTYSGGTFVDDSRAQINNAAGFGTGPVTVSDGGGVFFNTAIGVANNFTVSGRGWQENAGWLGVIRMINGSILNGTLTITGTPGDSGGDLAASDAAIYMQVVNATALSGTINGAVSGGDFAFGTNGLPNNPTYTGNETLTLTAANSYGDTIVRALDSATSGQITVAIGGATNTTATLGTGNVYLVGGTAGKSAGVRIQRSNGYTMRQDVIAAGNTAKTTFIADVAGTGLTLNGRAITVGEQVRLGGNGSGVSLNIDTGSSVTAGQFFTGNAANNSSTVNQTGGTVTVSGEVRVAHFAAETSIWNLSGGELNLIGVPTANPFLTAAPFTEDTTGKGTLYVGVDGQGTFNQSGGQANLAAIVLDGRTNTASGANMTTGIDQYNLTGGTLNLGSAVSAWGVQGNPSSLFTFGGGKLNLGASLPIAVPVSVTGTGSILDTKGFTATFKSNVGGSGTLAISDSTATTGLIAFEPTANATVTALLATSLPIEKSGAGTLIFSGAQTFTSPVSVLSGGLGISGSLSGSNVTVNGGTLLTGGSLTGNLSLAPAVNSALRYTGTPLAVTGNVALANTVTFNPVTDGLLPAGTYPLITYSGALTGSAANLALDPAFVPADYRSAFSFGATPGSLNLTVTGSPGSLTWNGTPGSLNWDVKNSSSWTGGPQFYQGDNVTFNDATVAGAAGTAAFTTNLTGDFNDLVFTARTAGPAGGAVSLRYVLPALPDQALSVSVEGSAITISLATDIAGLAASTATQIRTAVSGNPAANALVVVTNAAGDDGSGFATAMPTRYLTLPVTEPVNIPSGITVLPGSLTFANQMIDYAINGPGSIGGATALLKSGRGKLSLYASNGFTGGTTIAKGEIVILANAALGSGPLTFGDPTTTATDIATLTLESGSALTLPQLTVAATCPETRIFSTGGTLANTPLVKRGTGILTIGHPTDYTQAVNYITGTTSLLIEKGTVAFSSRTPLPTLVPITLGNASSDSDPTILEVPRASAADQLVLSAAIILGTVDPGDTSEAIIRYSGISAGSTTTGGAPSIQGTVNLNGRDLFIENRSHLTGGTTRLANFQSIISGTGHVHIRTGTNPDGSYNGGPRFRLNPNPNTTANSWTGNLYVDTGYVQIGNGSGTTAYNAIPDASVVIMSAGTGMGLGSSGETVRGLQGGTATVDVPFNALVSTNVGAASTSTLTLNDSTAGNTHVFDGVVANGSPGTLALTKNGAATQVLNGANTFTGALNVIGGTLKLTNWGVGTLGTITVSGTAGATLELSGSAIFNPGANSLIVGSTTSGTLNQKGGTVTFNSGNAVLVGNSTASNGTYNLSGGSLTCFSSATRGVILGFGAGSTGTMNVSEAGNLDLSSSILQIGRSDAAAANSTAVFNQTGGTALVGTLAIGGTGAGNTNSTVNLTAGVFVASGFTNLASATNDVVTLNLGGTADVTLPDFPTTRGTGAVATITFNGGTLRPVAASATFIGGLTNAFIRAGGATFDTTNGSITVTQPLLTDPVSTGGGLTKSGPNTLTCTGTPTFTGNITVLGGTLSMGAVNNNNESSTVTIATGARLQLGYTGTDTVSKLITGTSQLPAGIYGHTNSGATNGGLGVGAMDAWFAAGTGTLTVTSSPGTGGYNDWAATNAPTGTAADDFDGDGVSNGIEFVLGGDKNTNDAAKLPQISTTAGNMVFSFVRDQASIAATTTAVIEVGTVLSTWPVSYPVPDGAAANNPGVTVVKGSPVAGKDTVTLTVPQAPDGVKFARLKVTITP